MRALIEVTQRSRMVYSFMMFAGFYTSADSEETTKEQCSRIANLVSVKSVKAGTFLASPPDPYVKPKNGDLIMLYQGALKRTRIDPEGSGGATVVQQLSPGGYAGGVAMLRSDGTVEAVVAEAASLVLVAEGAAFFDLMEAAPPLCGELMLRAFGSRAPLDAVLNSPSAFAAFRAHQTREFASESSDFWSDSAKFVEQAWAATAYGEATPEAEAKQAALRALALEMKAVYLEEGAEKELNLPADVRQKTVAAISGGGALAPSVFDSARKEIHSLMKKDTLPRFKQTDEFTEILRQCGEPEPLLDVAAPSDLNEARQNAGVTPVKASRTSNDTYSPNYGS